MEIEIKSREERGIKDFAIYDLSILNIKLYHSTTIIYNKGGTLMKFKYQDEEGIKHISVKHLIDYNVKIDVVLEEIKNIESKYI